MSYPLDEISHFMKSYAVHEMETVFFLLSEINKNFIKWIVLWFIIFILKYGLWV